ncbi:MAG: hypothetical protein Q9170_002846 [Blastenia crenularia]
MTDQSKSPFSFGTSTSGGTGGLFGQQATTSQAQGGLFGSANNTAATSGPSLFGTSTTTGGASMFGGGAKTAGQPSNMFGGVIGGTADKPPPSFSFDPNPAGGSGGGGSPLFGQVQSSAGQQPGSSASFQGFATPNKPPNSTSTAPVLSSSLFGGGPSNLFQHTSSSTPGIAATPTSKPTFSFPPIGSTTPADPPPSSQGGGSNAFGLNLNNQQQEKISLFPSLGGDTNRNQVPSQSTSAPFQNAAGSGSGMFANMGKSQSSSSTQPLSSSGGSSPFTNLAGQTSAAPSGSQGSSTSIFAKPTQSTAAEAQKPTFSFASASSQAPTQAAPTPQANASNLFNLGASAKPATATTSAPSTNLFGSLSKSNDTAKSAAPPPNGAPTNIFTNKGKAQETPLSFISATTTNGQTQAPSTATTSTPNMFGKLGQPPSSAAHSQSTPTAATSVSEAKGNAGVAAGSTLGQSTSGPAPSAQSRLKNKSMDEIITRWASDLAKYQKEFQKQAEKVASWDHMLVENSEKIQKLYGSTLEAERATAEVERQITVVENDQAELEDWLNRYEKKVEEMVSNSGDSYHGPDSERERTYQLAEKLSTRLDEMGKDLGSMIEEINNASSALNKNTKPDDPLQQIDQGAAALQLKVAAAQKASQTLSPANGLNGPSSDAADSFYRSFMGRR